MVVGSLQTCFTNFFFILLFHLVDPLNYFLTELLLVEFQTFMIPNELWGLFTLVASRILVLNQRKWWVWCEIPLIVFIVEIDLF